MIFKTVGAFHPTVFLLADKKIKPFGLLTNCPKNAVFYSFAGKYNSSVEWSC